MPRVTRSNALAFSLGAVAVLGASALLGAGQAETREKPDLRSYAIGHDLGTSTIDRLQLDGVTHDRDALLQGFRDALEGRESVYQPAELAASLAVLQREVSTRLATQRLEEDPVFRALAEDNLRKSTAFMEKFAADEGSKPLAGGVYVKARSEGAGRSPKPEDTIRVSFQARLIDGTLIGDEFEMTARLDGMIQGAQTVLSKMKIGDRWIVAIPPEQAFGIGGRLPDIGPNQAILADVTLVGIE